MAWQTYQTTYVICPGASSCMRRLERMQSTPCQSSPCKVLHAHSPLSAGADLEAAGFRPAACATPAAMAAYSRPSTAVASAAAAPCSRHFTLCAWGMLASCMVSVEKGWRNKGNVHA